jgi:hypothetical protein
MNAVRGPRDFPLLEFGGRGPTLLWTPKALPADCCLDRLILETTTSSMNKALRNSDGTLYGASAARKQETRNAIVVMALQAP